MNTKTITIIFVVGLLLVVGAFVGLRYGGMLAGTGIEEGDGGLGAAGAKEYVVEEYVQGLEVPWGMAFTSPERLLVTERKGTVRLVENRILRGEPMYTFADVAADGEEGLMGVVLDPEYARNKHVFFSLAHGDGSTVKIVRLTDMGDTLADPVTIFDGIPAARYHAGSRIKVGPDGMLYITTGDAADKNLAQDKESLAGKILRIQRDGSIPEDNPFPGSPVWTLGHRNPQGLDWSPVSGELYSSEHGPSGFDGPRGGDEINRIVKGNNYGWPAVSHKKSREGMTDPLLVFTPAEAPASGTFYRSGMIPQFSHSFFVGALKGEGIIRISFDRFDPDKVLLHEKLPDIHYGRIRTVVEGPDGALYFSTSNRDGRGDPRPGDDHIYRIRVKTDVE